MVAPLLVMPAMLPYLGEKQFGLWMTIVSLTSMALFLDFGLGNGLLTRLADCYGKDDLCKAREYVSSAYAGLAGVATFLIALLLLATNTGLLMYFMPSSSIETARDYTKMIVVCFAAFIFSIPASLIQRIQYACQQIWLSNAWQSFGAVVSVLLTLWAINRGLSGWIVVACYALTPVLVLGISSLVFFSFQKPELTPSRIFVTRVSTTDLLSLGSRFLALAVLTSISLNIDNLIIAHQLGLAAVTDYAVPAKLTVLLGMLITVIFMPLWPANAEALARKDYTWVKATAWRMSIWGSLIVGVAACGLVAFSEPVMHLWMGRVFSNQHALIAWLSMSSVLMAACSPYHMIMNSVGFLKLQIAAWVTYLFVSATLKYILVFDFGLIGVAAVSALCYLAFIVPSAIIGANKVLKN